MPNISLANQDLFYTDRGSGFPLLILPDDIHTSLAYEAEAEYYSDRFRVISFDYPGTGRSTREVKYQDERSVDLWEHRSDFAMHLLLALGIDTCYVMGIGGGAVSALYFAGYHARLHDFTVKGVIADSFLSGRDARSLHRVLNRREHYYRRRGKLLEQMHGGDWRQVVDADTAFLRRIADQGGYEVPGYVLKSIGCPVLLTGSLTSPITIHVADDIRRVCSLIADCRVYLTSGIEHPFLWKDPVGHRTVVDLFFRQIEQAEEAK